MSIIDKLKDKDYVRAFGLMSQEEQEVYQKAGKENCLYYAAGSWSQSGGFARGFTYAIKPDYQPEPEFVDLEIVECQYGPHGILRRSFLGVFSNIHDEFLPLYILPSLPNFEGFRLKEGLVINLIHVASHYTKGKVFARFRRQQ